MPRQETIVQKSGSWAQFIVKWVIAAVGVILIAVGAVNVVKTVYKSSLVKYPVDSFRYGPIGSTYVGSDGKEVKQTDEEKKQQEEQIAEERQLAKINDYASSVASLLSGAGLLYVFRLITKHKE